MKVSMGTMCHPMDIVGFVGGVVIGEGVGADESVGDVVADEFCSQFFALFITRCLCVIMALNHCLLMHVNRNCRLRRHKNH